MEQGFVDAAKLHLYLKQHANVCTSLLLGRDHQSAEEREREGERGAQFNYRQRTNEEEQIVTLLFLHYCSPLLSHG